MDPWGWAGRGEEGWMSSQGEHLALKTGSIAQQPQWGVRYADPYQDAFRGIVGNGIKSGNRKCPMIRRGSRVYLKYRLYTAGYSGDIEKHETGLWDAWTNTSGDISHVCFSYIIQRLKGRAVAAYQGRQGPSFLLSHITFMNGVGFRALH